MTRTTTTLLALITAANLALAGGGQDGPPPVVVQDPPAREQQGTPTEQAQVGAETEVPTDVDEELEAELLAEDEQEATRTLSGVLRANRTHDEITLGLKRFELEARDKLPLSVLAGREVELLVEETGRGKARVLNTISPRGWTGNGVVRPNADGGLELINDTQRLTIVNLPEGVAERIVNKKVAARGWVYPGSNELVFSGASARTVVATDKAGRPSETAWLNERTVDANGVATYGTRHTLEPGTEVFVFDIAAYKRAKRDDAGKIVAPGVWRPSLQDMVGGDTMLVRASVTQREGNGTTGWIPLRKVSFGEVAGPPADDPTPPAQQGPVQEEPTQGGLTDALDLDLDGDPVPPAEEERVQTELEQALGVETETGDSDLEDLVDAANGEDVDVDLDLEEGQDVPPVVETEADPHQPAVEAEEVQAGPQIDIDLGQPVSRTAMVIASELNVRSQADYRSPALLVALHGESVKILEDDGGRWVKVELAPPAGYVYNRFLEPTGEQTGKVRTFTVKPSHLKLREGPNMGDNVASYVIGGSVLQAVGSKGGWIKIQQSEPVVGYVVRNALNLE